MVCIVFKLLSDWIVYLLDDKSHLLVVMAGEEVVTALGSEVDRLEKEIQGIVPGIRHVDIEAHNPIAPSPWFPVSFLWEVILHNFSQLMNFLFNIQLECHMEGFRARKMKRVYNDLSVNVNG